ncbi:hypothetical protein Pr1d_34830 [Bythopirellula goksoeyrii]|uniref:Uncharacterized protein n=2 Tax=Bythopirellula goksoeyrii TaxID=1400387 RepID=A0A5B9QAU9_9BACT|nr:hypothetical protein Pr1d_34830 [Bythopirellula goksoeyrii]
MHGQGESAKPKSLPDREIARNCCSGGSTTMGVDLIEKLDSRTLRNSAYGTFLGTVVLFARNLVIRSLSEQETLLLSA